MRLRSIELEVPDRSAAVRFLKEPWGLLDCGTKNGISYLRGSADHPYVVSIADAPAPAVTAITFSGSETELKEIRARASGAGARIHPSVPEFDEPGRAAGFLVEGPEGQVFRFVAEKERVASLPPSSERPVQVTHVVLNAVDPEACSRFTVEALGFKLSDRTNFMNFVRCDSTHHALAFARAEQSSLNHIAFEMTDLDAVMRGIGRLKDSGFDPVWGPGRHGPGNNVFGYFAAPFGAIVEYTSEILRIDDSYRVGGPEDWKWPPNRTDHWGISGRKTSLFEEAGRRFRFRRPAQAQAGR